MYDELIKRARQVAEEVCDDYDVDPYIAEQRSFVIEEAADAIEELRGWNNALRDSVAMLMKKIAKLGKRVPHGRSIDADALLKKCEFVCTDDDEDIRAVRYSAIEDAPTIIPAEPEVHDCDNCKWFGGLMCDHVDENYKCLGWEAEEGE